MVAVFFCGIPVSNAAENNPTKVVLLISEQNISGQEHAWWVGQIDLSSTESVIASKLTAEGFVIVDPQALSGLLEQDAAFRLVPPSEKSSLKLASLANADYVVVGKAVATAGGNVPQSNMLSCYANTSAKLLRVKDGSVVAYVRARGNSAHLDVVSGGDEALQQAAEDISLQLIEQLKKTAGAVPSGAVNMTGEGKQ